MDRIEALGSQLSQITMYDIKSMYNQVGLAEVRCPAVAEYAGASSTLMQEIAQGTFNFQHFNEIMPCIYSRFMEKEASQWRQIYKALQLLEYLIKHGSERVIDDARSHISTIKMLRNFHYIDDKAKDQGINVRNRAKEIAELLSDVDKIRQERRKAKTNRNKYTGTGNDGGLSFTTSSGGRYGGFGSDSGGYGGGGGGYGGGYDQDRDYSSSAVGGSSSYSGGGGGSGSGGGGRRDRERQYDEYDAGDWEDAPRRSTTSTPSRSASMNTTTNRTTTATPTPAPPPPKAPAVNLLDFGDDEPAVAPAPAPVVRPAPAAAPAPVAAPAVSLDDDFDDFQSAPVQSPTVTTPAVAPAAPKTNIFDMLGSAPAPATNSTFAPAPAAPAFGAPSTFGNVQSPSAMSFGSQPLSPTSLSGAPARPPMQSTMSASSGPNYFASAPIMSPTSTTGSTGSQVRTPGAPTGGAAKASGNFDDLWSMSLGSSSTSSAKPATGAGAGKSIKDLEREKAQATIWGSGGKPASGGGFGAFSGSTGGGAASGGGGGDLLF
ncbi:Epsin-3, clathrin recruitment and traffic between the Golgi and endosome [Ceratobasidium sp. 395]|nr:Epsin-3, clathrin recruitment and traffic between the Golgi and endosome [Ceratobasidium sp. 395]